jgi:hypothetical protein
MPDRIQTGPHADLSDLSAGRVLYSRPGLTAFPVRLAAQVFARCLELRSPGSAPLALYDPCCGGAYHLAVLGFLFPDLIGRVAASDIDPAALELARRNLGLLSPAGLARRESELRGLLARYGKDSHREALGSLERLRALRLERETPARIFQADAGDSPALLRGLDGWQADLVFSDVPYGWHSAWQGGRADPVAAMLEALLPLLAPRGLVAVASDKAQKPAHPAYRKLGGFRLGRRQATILQVA